MINVMTRIGMAGLAVLLMGASAMAEEQLVLKTQKERENYATGVEFVKKLKQQGGAVNLDLVIRGMQDELTGDTLLTTDQDVPTAVAVRKTSSEVGQKIDSAVPQKQDAPERADDPITSQATFAKKEEQALKTVPGGPSGQVVPKHTGTPGKSVVELDKARIAIRTRALEMRKRLMEQHRQQELAGHM